MGTAILHRQNARKQSESFANYTQIGVCDLRLITLQLGIVLFKLLITRRLSLRLYG